MISLLRILLCGGNPGRVEKNIESLKSPVCSHHLLIYLGQLLGPSGTFYLLPLLVACF